MAAAGGGGGGGGTSAPPAPAPSGGASPTPAPAPSYSNASLSDAEIAAEAANAGIPWSQVPTAVAIALAESGGNPHALDNNPSTGDLSYGLWQVNMIGSLGPARAQQFGLCSASQVQNGQCGQTQYQGLWDPATNAKAMAAISNHGSDWSAWTTYTRGTYQQYLSRGTQATQQANGNVANLVSQAGQQVASGGISQVNAAPSGGAGSCQHNIHFPGLLGAGAADICMDKPLAAVQIAGGVLILLVGTVILGAALIGGAFPGAREAAKTALPVGRVVKGARRVSAARRASQGRQQAQNVRAQSAQVREARAAEIHTQRVARGRAQLRTSRARARITEAKAREARGQGDVVYLGGRPVRKSSLSPRMRDAVEKAS